MKIGVQLYTLRSSFEKDLWGTFDALAKVGYKHVELAGTYGLPAKDLAAELKKRGLKVTSAHVGIDQFENDLESLVAMAEAFEFKDLIVPWLNPDQQGGWKVIGEKLNTFADKLAPHGLKVGYHNHAFEFEVHDGKMGYEILWETADAKKVLAEVDLYWVTKGGQDPIYWLDRLKGHVPFTHFKDMKKDAETYTEVGSGRMDWPAIIAAGKKAGVQYAIVEHDEPEMDPIESVKISREYLLKQGLTD